MLKPVDLSTMNPINKKQKKMSHKGGCRFLNLRTPQLKPLKIENDIVFLKIYIIYHNNYYQHIWKCDFFNFQPTLLNILEHHPTLILFDNVTTDLWLISLEKKYILFKVKEWLIRWEIPFRHLSTFLSSANKVSTGPTCQYGCLFVCLCALYFRSFSVTNFLGS